MRLAPLLIVSLALMGCRPIGDGAAGSGPALAAERGTVASAGGFRIIDGDTFELQGETIRIANIDAPEMPPRSRCWAEARLARAAAYALDDIRADSRDLGRAMITREGRDRYGRTLARVTFDGELDAGEMMIEAGLAAPWTGRRWDWCAPVTDDANGQRIVAEGPTVLDALIAETPVQGFDPNKSYTVEQ